MFKKAAQIAVTFSLLVGAYLGYSQGFAVVVVLIGRAQAVSEATPFFEADSRTTIRSHQLAVERLGASSFAAKRELQLVYYDSSRGMYLYAEEYQRLDEGRRIRAWPFAMISDPQGGKSCKTVTSDEVEIVLNQPFGMVKPNSEPSKVLQATLTGNVKIRDDKGTVEDLDDDLRIGPLAAVHFEDKTLQVTTDSEVILQDRDMTMTGLGMMIQLRRQAVARPPASPTDLLEPAKPTGGGFEAETATLWKNVHIVINDGTTTGVLPGKSKPDAKGRTPLDLRCDQKMLVELPKSHPPVLVGPPWLDREPDPTFAHFFVNVRVVRGTTTPDQLNCDVLHLTLAPDRKPVDPASGDKEKNPDLAVVAATPEPSPPPLPSIGGEADAEGGTAAEAVAARPKVAAAPAGGPLTELKLKRALAEGHAVWIQSESQGMRARCRELVHEKSGQPGIPDTTYLNGGPGMQLNVEKVDYVLRGENAGAIESVRTLKALDAKIFDYGNDSGKSKIICRGPGEMKERPARNASVERTAWFEDEMEVLTYRDPAPLPPPGARAEVLATTTPASDLKPLGMLRRKITLRGPSKLVDVKGNATLDARKQIIADLESAPRTDGKPGDGPSQIKWLKAIEDVHLTSSNRVLSARQTLDAKFEQPEILLANSLPAPAAGSPIATPAPANPLGAPMPMPATTSTPATDAAAPEPATVVADKPPEPIEPAVDGRANYVYATILQGAGANAKGEIKDAKLRGGVMIHQDPGPNETLGKNAYGEALDLTSQGKGLMKFLVAADDPQAAAPPRAKLLGLGDDGKPPRRADFARVEFQNRVIEGPLIGLDQKNDFVWVVGAGNYMQMAERGLLDDQGLDAPRSSTGQPLGSGTKDRMVITWNESMQCFGFSKDLLDRPAAKFEFRGRSEEVRTPDGRTEFRRGVQVKMEDSAIYCDSMNVYTDKPIPFSKVASPGSPAPKPKAGEPAEPDAQIAMLDCRGEHLMVDGLMKYAGVDITSQKRYPGTKFLKEKQRIRHTHVVYDKRSGDFEAPGAGIVNLFQAEEKSVKKEKDALAARFASNPGATPRVFIPRKALPFKLTKVTFNEGMRGKFGVAKDKDDRQTRTSTFVGAVQAANAEVPTANNDLDFDRLRQWPDSLFLTSDILTVYSVPAQDDPTKPPQQLLNARGNAKADTVDSFIDGDRITYDSATDLCYVYGDDGKEVHISQQKSLGQDVNTTRGTAARYNKKTGAGTIINPSEFQFVDLGTGTRPKPFYPDLGGSPKPFDPIKAHRTPLARPSRNSTERNPFTGH